MMICLIWGRDKHKLNSLPGVLIMPHILSYNPTVLVQNCTKSIALKLKLNDWMDIDEFFGNAARILSPDSQIKVGTLATKLVAADAKDLAELGCQSVDHVDGQKMAADMKCHVMDWDKVIG